MGWSRRTFLWALGGLAAGGARAFGQRFHLRRPKPQPQTVFPVYFGTDTDKGGAEGIYRGVFDAKTGQLGQVSLAAATPRPTFLAWAATPGRRVMYAVNELLTDQAAVSGFAVEPKTGGLQGFGQISSGGAGPCFVSVDATAHAAFVADYNGNRLSTYRVGRDGGLAGPVEHVDMNEERFGKDGPNGARQDGAHPHSATISPDNRFVLVNLLGHDAIAVFGFDPETAKLSAKAPFLFSNNRPGSGPRHVVFHPNGRWVYGINELDSTIDHYLWTTTHGAEAEALLVVAGPPVKTIAEDFPAERNGAAEVAVSPNGFYLYASNRGENSLVVFGIDQTNGSLKLIERVACGGKTPRNFALDPSGGWLLCGNQDSDTVTVFRRDGATGRLQGPVGTVRVPAPMFVLFG